MEGVLVSAKRADSTMTVTVATDAQGRYSFPRSRLEPGSTRFAFGRSGTSWMAWNRQRHGPPDGATRTETAQGEGPCLSALERRVVHELARQRRDEERPVELHAVPQSRAVARSRYTAAEWVAVIERMATVFAGQHAGAPAAAARTRDRRAPSWRRAWRGAKANGRCRTSSSPRPPSTSRRSISVRRPRGRTAEDLSASQRATRRASIITEYDLPRPETLPHDAAADADGMIWYADFGSHVLGMLDPKDAQGRRISAADHQAGRAARLARPRARQAGQHLDGDHVPGQPGEVRPQDEDVPDLGLADVHGAGRSAHRDGDAHQPRRGRAGLDWRRQRIPGGREDRRVEGGRLLGRAAEGLARSSGS